MGKNRKRKLVVDDFVKNNGRRCIVDGQWKRRSDIGQTIVDGDSYQRLVGEDSKGGGQPKCFIQIREINF